MDVKLSKTLVIGQQSINRVERKARFYLVGTHCLQILRNCRAAE